MDNFKVFYKILKILEKHKGDEKFSNEMISASAMKLEYEEWEQLMIMLQDEGYIKGIVYDQDLGEAFPHIEKPIKPRITMKGLEYLAKNSMMAKAKELLALAGDII